MKTYLISKKDRFGRSLYLHRELNEKNGALEGQCYMWRDTTEGAYAVKDRTEGKNLIRKIDPLTSVNDLSFRKAGE
jgi:hypothetical protein